MVDKDPDKVTLSFEKEFRAEREKTLDLEARLNVRESRIGRLEKEVSRLRKGKGEGDELPEVSVTLPAASPGPQPHVDIHHEESKTASPHIMKGYTPRFCGDKGCESLPQNPAFKDETKCSTPGCGMHLGSLENVEKNLARCPNCGGSKFDRT